jgi:squalene-hopene/tetraprenyl-beta-curcumene cyclase
LACGGPATATAAPDDDELTRDATTPAIATAETLRAAEQTADSAISYLRSVQHGSGGWSTPPEGRPHLPAITALVLHGMLLSDDLDHTDPAVAKGVEYLLSFQQADGGIYDRILASYNTALAVSALTQVDTDDARAAVQRALPFLRGLQWHEGAANHPSTGRVPHEHPFHGGVGYGGSSRPDNSNLNLWLQAMHDAGVPGDDPAFQRALVFLSRTQMLDGVNDMPYADGSQQGGFIYSTSPNAEQMGIGESKAGTIVETLSDGTTASRLRSYGSMTYAGFKSLIYADLDRDDERLQAAWNWIRENYTLEENPGIGTDGYYYFILAFGRCLDAWGVTEIETREVVDLTLHVPVPPDPLPEAGWSGDVTSARTVDGRLIRFEHPPMTARAYRVRGDGPLTIETAMQVGFPLTEGARWEVVSGGVPFTVGDFTNPAETKRTVDVPYAYVEGAGTLALLTTRDWRRDLVAKLEELQREDGSFRPVDDRWMEDNPVLITAYSLIALQHAIDSMAATLGAEHPDEQRQGAKADITGDATSDGGM